MEPGPSVALKPVVPASPRAPMGGAAPGFAPVPARPPVAPAGEALIGAGKAGQEVHQAQSAMVDPNIRRLQTAGGLLQAPLFIEFFGMLAAGLAGLAGKAGLHRTRTIMLAPFVSTIEALRNTPNLLKVPAAFVRSFGNKAAESGGKAAKWAEPAAAKAAAMDAVADARTARIKDVVKPAFSALGDAADKLSATSVGKTIEGWANRFSAYRVDRIAAKNEKIFERALNAARDGQPGFFQRIGHFFKGAKPPLGEINPHLASYASRLESAKALSGEARIDALATLGREMQEAVSSSGLPKEIVGKARSMANQVVHAVSSSQAYQAYSTAVDTGSLRGAAKAAVKAIANMPMFGKVVGAGVVAAIGAHVLIRRAEHKHTKELTQEITAAGNGDTNSPFMRNVLRAENTAKHSSTARAALHTANELGTGAFAMLPGGGGGAIMVGQMAPMLLEPLVPQAAFEKAFEALDAAEKGKIQLSEADQVQLRREIVAMHPSVPRGEGIYNHLVRAVAERMQEEKMPLRAMIKLLDSEEPFTQYAAETKTRMDAKANAAKAPTANDNGGSLPEGVTPISAAARYEAAAKPTGAVVMGSGKTAQGTVVAPQQKAMA